MFLRLLPVVALLLLMRKPAVAQTLNGTVTDAATGEALYGATVYFPVAKTGTTTNAYGYFAVGAVAI